MIFIGIWIKLMVGAARKNIVNIVHPTLPYPLFSDKENDFIGMVVSK